MAENSDDAGKKSAASRESHPHDVFISYSSQNKVVADTVCAVLELNGVRCWMAPRDITPGAEWAGSIIHAINDTRAFVLIFSSFANTSLQVKREVERAANRGVPIIPFRLEDIPANETLEFFISTPHWLDALSPPLETHAEHLSRVIERLLGDTKPKLSRARRTAAAAEALAETVEDAQEAAAPEPVLPPTAAPEPPPPPQPTPPKAAEPPPAPTTPAAAATPATDTAATIAAAQALAAPHTASAAAVPGFQPNTSAGEAPITAPIAQTRPPMHPMEPVWATAIGGALAVLPMLATLSPSAGWSLLTLFSLPIVVSLFRLTFVRPLKAIALWFALIIVYSLATGVGFGMVGLMGHGGPLSTTAVFFTAMVTALTLTSGSYASLILWGNRLSTGPAMRMTLIYSGVASLAGAILAGLWQAVRGQDLRMGPVDILFALPWLAIYGAGFFAVAAATVNPLLSADGRRNVTEQSSARMHDQVTLPHSQGVFLASVGVIFGLFVLMFTLVAAAGASGGAVPLPGVNAVQDPNAPKDPNGADPNAQPAPEPAPPPYEPPPQQDGYDANPPVDQQGGGYENQ